MSCAKHPRGDDAMKPDWPLPSGDGAIFRASPIDTTSASKGNVMSLSEWGSLFAASFVALFPVANPIGNGFIVNDFLEGLDDGQRKAIIRKISLCCLLIGLSSLVVGKLVLLMFGLAVPVIQVGGGVLIGKMGFDWLSGPSENATSEGQKTIDKINIVDVEQKVFYPISFPVCFGPGSISVVFALMAGASEKASLGDTLIHYLAIALAIVALCGFIYVYFSQGSRIMRRLGHRGSLVINKLVAFFTFCIGIQIAVTGLSRIFHLSIML